MTRRHFLTALPLAALLAAGAGWWLAGGAGSAPPVDGLTRIEPPRPLDWPALRDQHGEPFGADRLQGRWHVLFFGFTHCPDVCPLTLGLLAQAQSHLGPAQRAASRVVLVTLDPMRDTPQRLRGYLRGFSDDFVGLTAPLGTLQPLLGTLGVAYAYRREDAAAASAHGPAQAGHAHAGHAQAGHAHDRAPAEAERPAAAQAPIDRDPHAAHGAPAYTIEHPGTLYFIDPQGRLAALLTHPQSPARVSAILAGLIGD